RLSFRRLDDFVILTLEQQQFRRKGYAVGKPFVVNGQSHVEPRCLPVGSEFERVRMARFQMLVLHLINISAYDGEPFVGIGGIVAEIGIIVISRTGIELDHGRSLVGKAPGSSQAEPLRETERGGKTRREQVV